MVTVVGLPCEQETQADCPRLLAVPAGHGEASVALQELPAGQSLHAPLIK